MPGLTPYIRFYGNEDHCKLFLRQCRTELAKTVAIAENAGYSSYQRRMMLDADTNTYALFRVDVGVHAISITSGMPLPEPTEEISGEEKGKEEKEIQSVVTLWSGMCHYHHVLYDPGGDPSRPSESYPFMKEFKPTEAAFKQFEEEFPGGLTYQDVSRLTPRADFDLLYEYYDQDRYGPSTNPPGGSDYKSQTDLVRPGNFSGLLAEAASIVLGYGTFNTNGATRAALLEPSADSAFVTKVTSTGFQLQYDWRFDRSHGIVRDTQGDPWLVECSYSNGIIARRLPMLNTEIVKVSTLDKAEQEAIKRLGGFPSGESFPLNVTSMLNDGEVVQLMSAAQWRTEFANDNYGWAGMDYVGWAFSDTSNEARIASYDGEDADGYTTGNYWKLKFSINSVTETYSATLTLIDSSTMHYAINGTGSGSNVYFYDPYNRRYNVALFATPVGKTPADVVIDQVMWVGWMNGTWSEVHYYADRTFPDIDLHPPPITPAMAEAASGTFYWGLDADGTQGPYRLLDSNYTTEIPLSRTTISNTDTENKIIMTGGTGQVHRCWPSNNTIKWSTHIETFYDLYSGGNISGAASILIQPYSRSSYFFIRYRVKSNTYKAGCVHRHPFVYAPEAYGYVSWSNEYNNYGAGYPYPAEIPYETNPYIPRYGTPSLINRATGGINILNSGSLGPCDDPPYPPTPAVWLYTWTTFAYQTGEPCNYISDTPVALTKSLCDTVFEDDEIFSNITEKPLTSMSYRITNNTEQNEGSYSFDSWLVGHRIPEGKITFPHFSANDEDYEYGIGWFNQHFSQTAMLGELAVVYTNPTKSTNPGNVYNFYLEVEITGTCPGLPNTGDHISHRTLSFVGINGP